MPPELTGFAFLFAHSIANVASVNMTTAALSADAVLGDLGFACSLETVFFEIDAYLCESVFLRVYLFALSCVSTLA